MDPSWLTDTSCNSVIGPGRWDGSYLVQWKLKEMDRYPGPNAQCMVCMYMYTWNPNDPYFDWKRPSFGGFKPQNRGQTGSIYIYQNPPRVSNFSPAGLLFMG